MALEVYSVPLSLRWLPGARADGRCCPVRERPCVPTAMCRPPGPGIRACSCRSRSGCGSAARPSSGRRRSLSRDSLAIQRIAISLCVEGGDGVVNGGVERVEIGEGPMSEMSGFQVTPDDFDVVQLRGVFGQPL